MRDLCAIAANFLGIDVIVNRFADYEQVLNQDS